MKTDVTIHIASEADLDALVRLAVAFRDHVGERTPSAEEFCELCRRVGFWRPNPKIGYQKINDVRVSTFLLSVICDRAL